MFPSVVPPSKKECLWATLFRLFTKLYENGDFIPAFKVFQSLLKDGPLFQQISDEEAAKYRGILGEPKPILNPHFPHFTEEELAEKMPLPEWLLLECDDLLTRSTCGFIKNDEQKAFIDSFIKAYCEKQGPLSIDEMKAIDPKINESFAPEHFAALQIGLKAACDIGNEDYQVRLIMYIFEY
jgi:hypothetical protein